VRQSRGPTVTRRRLLEGAAVFTVFAAASAASAQSRACAEDAAAIEALIARMTLEEKLGQLVQIGGGQGPVQGETTSAEDELRAGRVGSFLGVKGAETTARLQRIAVEETRLGIPVLFADDVIHGLRTIFPVPIAEAASFDPSLAERSARIAAIEAAAHGVHWTFAPMVDVARDPRWGRVVEGAGEDPFLGAAMAAARVRGFQGLDLAADDTVLATAKHFVAYGAAEGGRDYNVADISERSLHEVYLPPFRAAVDAGVASVMGGFNEIGGSPMHANEALIDGVLRGQWGFDGLVVSDYTAVRELIAHGVAESPEAAGVRALQAGVDVDMVDRIYIRDLPRAVRAGRLAEAEVDTAVRRVLRAKQRVGLFADPYRYSDPARERARTLTPDHRAAAREAARKSFVLLKNEGDVLPLSRELRSLAVIGPLADDGRAMLGSWQNIGRPEDVVTPLGAIRTALGGRVTHARGCGISEPDQSGFAQAVRAAREADAVLLCLGEAGDMSGEARSRTSLDLPGAQEALAGAVLATGKPVAVILFAGRPLSIPWLAENARAILLAWFPGVEAGPALADVIFGDHSPAGRLPITFPRNVGQVPIHYDHRNTGRPPSAADEYTSKYIDAPWTPLFPFGHGLSYTRFAYDRLRLSAARIGPRDSIEARVRVTNTGARDGDDVVQLYVRDDIASFTRPSLRLRGFERIHLRRRERRELSFTLGPADFACLDADMLPVVEPGAFTIFAGGSSANLIEARFEVTEA
jgi:beta-glucosidase